MAAQSRPLNVYHVAEPDILLRHLYHPFLNFYRGGGKSATFAFNT